MNVLRAYKGKVSALAEDIIVSQYRIGNRIGHLAIKYNIGETTIRCILKKNSIDLRGGKDAETLVMLNLNKQGKNNKEIAAIINMSHLRVSQRLFDNKAIANKYFYRSKRVVDDFYFNSIDTQNKSYFLGLFFADGSVDSAASSNKISISLIEEDGYLLEMFLAELKSDYPLLKKMSKNKNWSNQVYFNVCSNQIKNDLIKAGCTPRKSLTAKFPGLPDGLLWHFIRGYFDGDGCISCFNVKDNGNVYPTKAVTICGSESFCRELQNRLNAFGIVSYVRKPKKSKIFTLCMSKRVSISDFANRMYKDANIFMKRKYKKFYQ